MRPVATQKAIPIKTLPPQILHGSHSVFYSGFYRWREFTYCSIQRHSANDADADADADAGTKGFKIAKMQSTRVTPGPDKFGQIGKQIREGMQYDQ